MSPSSCNHGKVILTEVQILQLWQPETYFLLRLCFLNLSYLPGHGVDVSDLVAAEVEPGEAGQGLQGGHGDGGQLVRDQAQGVQRALQTVECLDRNNMELLEIHPSFRCLPKCYAIINQRKFREETLEK